jgi:hypothetical protein
MDTVVIRVPKRQIEFSTFVVCSALRRSPWARSVIVANDRQFFYIFGKNIVFFEDNFWIGESV